MINYVILYKSDLSFFCYTENLSSIDTDIHVAVPYDDTKDATTNDLITYYQPLATGVTKTQLETSKLVPPIKSAVDIDSVQALENKTLINVAIDTASSPGQVWTAKNATGGGNWATVSKRTIINTNVNTVGANLPDTDYVYFISGPLSFTLPSAVNNKNSYLIILKVNATVNILTQNSQTINGSNGLILKKAYTQVQFFSDGVNWFA